MNTREKLEVGFEKAAEGEAEAIKKFLMESSGARDALLGAGAGGLGGAALQYLRGKDMLPGAMVGAGLGGAAGYGANQYLDGQKKDEAAGAEEEVAGTEEESPATDEEGTLDSAAYDADAKAQTDIEKSPATGAEGTVDTEAYSADAAAQTEADNIANAERERITAEGKAKALKDKIEARLQKHRQDQKLINDYNAEQESLDDTDRQVAKHMAGQPRQKYTDILAEGLQVPIDAKNEAVDAVRKGYYDTKRDVTEGIDEGIARAKKSIGSGITSGIQEAAKGIDTAKAHGKGYMEAVKDNPVSDFYNDTVEGVKSLFQD